MRIGEVAATEGTPAETATVLTRALVHEVATVLTRRAVLGSGGEAFMTEVLLFHHAQGLTDGVRAFAWDLRAAGHRVTVPDLYDGRTFATLDEGVAHADELGVETIVARGAAAAEDLPRQLVYAGFSLGVLAAQSLAQQRVGALGALLYHSAVPLGSFGDRWPDAVPVEVHLAVEDPWEDLDEVATFTAAAGGQLWTYPGDRHLFTDRSLPDHDAQAAQLVLQRSLAFLTRVG